VRPGGGVVGSTHQVKQLQCCPQVSFRIAKGEACPEVQQLVRDHLLKHFHKHFLLPIRLLGEGGGCTNSLEG